MSNAGEEGPWSRASSGSEESCECEHSHSHGHGHTHEDTHNHSHTHTEHSEHGEDHSHTHDHAHGHKHGAHSGGCEEEEEDDCCTHDHAHSHAHNHSHSHAHAHTHHTESLTDSQTQSHSHTHAHSGCCDEEEEDDCCAHSHSHSHDHSHNDSHNHSHAHAHSGCCEEEEEGDCCSHNHSHANDHTHTHAHTHGHTHTHTEIDLEAGEGDALLLIDSNDPSALNTHTHTVSLSLSAAKCNSCDPASAILHLLQVTRFRVANLCCAGEEKLIREALREMIGVEHVAINVIGRYAVVKHCTVPCCAPSEKILDTLNALHLGVSIHEVADDDEQQGKEKIDVNDLLHVSVVAALFLAGLVLYLRTPTHSLSTWVFVPSIAIGLVPIVQQAFISLVWRRTIDINTLIIVAVAGAIAVDEFFDAALVVVMFLAAEFIERAVMVVVRNAISLSTSSTMPKKAFTVDGHSVSVEELKVGEVVACRAGEMVVCDGKVLRGEGVVDESSLTGEAVPIQKKAGSTVMSGTVMQNGYLEVEVTKSAQESTMKQLKQAVEDVQADRGEYAALVDRFAGYWTPAIVAAAVLLIVIGGGVTEDWKGYLNRGLVLLILACPCAIVVAAPIPSVCAIATAAKNGVLVKGSTVIEKLCTIDTVAVDKTGTLTKGYFQVRNKLILLLDNYDNHPATHAEGVVRQPFTNVKKETLYDDPYKLAVALEAKSTHPLANAIVSDYCGCIADMLAEDLVLPSVKKVHVREGVGLEGYVQVKTSGPGQGEEEKKEWRHVVVGNERLLTSHGGKIQATPTQERQIEGFIADNDTCVILLIVIDAVPRMLLSLADEVRLESRGFVRDLAAESISVSMLTGDHQSVAKSICEELQIRDCQSRLLPEQKLQWIKDAQALQGKRVLMIGDGINDSTALACSTVGVAMGAGGTAMAVAAADVVLLNDNLSLLPTTLSLCRLTKDTIVQNCVFAIVVKIVAMVLAVVGMLEFWEAVLIDIGSLLLVVVNGSKVLFFHKYRRTEMLDTKTESKKESLNAPEPVAIQEV